MLRHSKILLLLMNVNSLHVAKNPKLKKAQLHMTPLSSFADKALINICVC